MRYKALMVAFGLCVATAAAAQTPWKILERWKVGGEGGWDYLSVEPGSTRLFVSRSSRVDVIDTASGRIVGSLSNTRGVHGIAFAKALNRAYTSNGRGNSVSAFALDTLALIQEVTIPAVNPDAILFEPTGGHVFTFNGTSKNVTVLDGQSLALLATIGTPDKPEFAVDDGAGEVFVNIESSPGKIMAIDARKLKGIAIWPLPGCDSPSGLAIDTERHRLFSVCQNKVMVVTDAQTGKQVAHVAIGERPDAAAYDALKHLVFSSNGAGTLSIIRQKSADEYAPSDTLTTQPGARTMALDPTTGRVYLVTADFAKTSANGEPESRPKPIQGSFIVMQIGTP